MNNIEECQNTIELLKQALKFYADKSNYDVKHPVNNVLFSYVEMDCGTQARFALEKIKKMEDLNKKMENEFIKNPLGITDKEYAENLKNAIEEFKNLAENFGNKL